VRQPVDSSQRTVRKTAAGLIPADWSVSKIGAFCTTYSGGTPSTVRPDFYGGDIPWIVSSDMNKGIIDSVDGRITERGLRNSSAKLVSSGTLLLALYGATAGVPAMCRIEGTINQAVLAIIPRGNDPRYLYEWLTYQRNSIIETFTQGGQPNLSGELVRKISVPLPSEPEQLRISAILADFDSLIVALEGLLTKKQAMKHGIMQQLLTGKTRLPGFDGEWREWRLGELLAYEQPTRYLVTSSKQLSTGRIPVLTAGKTFILGYTNDLHGVFTEHPVIIFDDFTTASKYVDFPFKAKSSAMKILRARAGTNLRFVYERMQLIDFSLGDHKRYWISEYSQLPVTAPGLAEQDAIAAVLADVDAEIVGLRDRLRKAKNLKQGVVQQLLTGRTRLPIREAVT